MKLYLPILLAGLLACNISADVPAFTIDREYTYQYESRVATGIAANVKQFAGLGIKGNVIIQNQGNYLYAKFDKLLYGQFNDKVNVSMSEEFQMPYTPVDARHTFVKEALTKPIRVTVENGLVKCFQVHLDDPEWSVNVKRAILSLFQLNFDRVNKIRFSTSNYLKQDDDNENFFRVMEDGIGGDCETIYEINSHPYYKHPYERVLNVTKHRNYGRCTNRPVTLFATHQAYKCDSCKTQEPLQVVSTTEYQIHGDRRYHVIEKIYNTAKYIFSPFGTNSESTLSGVNQTLFLTETSSIKEPITFPEKYLTYTSLTYNKSEDRHNTNEVDLDEPNYYNRNYYYKYNNYKEKVGEYLVHMSQNVQVTDDLNERKYPEKVAQLVKIFGTLSFEEFKDLYKTHMDYDYSTATPEKQRQKSIFYEVLTYIGTNPSIKFILYALENNYLPAHIGSQYFDRIAFYVKDHSETLTEYFYNFTRNLDKDDKRTLYKTFFLAFGTLVNHGCRHDSAHQHDTHHIRPETCKRYLKETYGHFEKATKSWERSLYMRAVQNMGLPESYSYIKPIATGEKPYNTEIRHSAIEVLYWLIDDLREEVLSLAVPLFYNYSEPVTVRLSAFEIIMQANPSSDALQSIGDRLQNDPSRQIVSYVYSSYVALANSTNPCNQEIGDKTRLVLQNIPKYNYGDHYAHKYLYSYYNDKYNFGGETLISHTGSNESIIPEYVYIQNSYNFLGYNIDYVGVEYQAVGLSKIFKRLFSKDGSQDPAKSLWNLIRRHPRNVDTNKKELDEIESKLNIATREAQPIEGGFTFWMFNQQFRYLHFDESLLPTVEDAGYFYLPKDLPKVLENGLKFNTHKTVMIDDVNYEVPTEIGFPLSFSVQYPGYGSITGQLKVNVKPGFFPEDRDFKIPSSVEVDVDIQPMIHMQANVQIAVKTPIMNSYGFGVTHDVSTKYALNLGVTYNTKEKKFDFTYKPSQSKYEMFNMKTHPYTFIDKRTNYVAAVDEPLTKPIHVREEPYEVAFSLGHSAGTTLKYYEKHEYPSKSCNSAQNFFENFVMKKNIRTSGDRVKVAYMYLKDRQFFTPRIVPVDMKIYFVPSKDQPTTEYQGTLTIETYYKTATQSRLPKLTAETIVPTDPTFRKQTAVHLNVVAKGQTERTYQLDYTVSKDFNHMFRKETLDYSRSAIPGYDSEPFKLCYQCSLKLPTYNTWYSFDSNIEKKAESAMSINFGKDCTSGSKIDITGVVERSDEEKEYDANPSLYPTYGKCEEQRKQGYNITQECRTMFFEYYNLRKYAVDIHYENLPKVFEKYGDHFEFLMSYLLASNLDHVDKEVQNPAGHIKLTSNHSMYEPKMDLQVHRPGMTIYYTDINYPEYFGPVPPFNLRYDQHRRNMHNQYQFTRKPMCRVQKNHHHTFDSVHYTFDAPQNCYYVLAKDCSKHNKFTILAKDVTHSSPDINKAIKMFMLNHKIEILPLDANSPLVVRIDDVLKTIAPQSVYLLPNVDHPDQDELVFKIVNTGSTYYIQAPLVGLTVIYNGDYILTKVNNEHRGRLCGLCGNLNGEATNEFMGPKGCVYNNNQAFGYSYVLPDQTCTVPENIDQTCTYPYAPKYKGKCTIRRNKVIHNVATDSTGIQASNVCFSILPIPQCAPGCKVADGQYVKRKIGFHCLNTRDHSTKDLITRSKIAELELQNKSKDYNEVIEYPERCVKA